ncbi:MAG: hypothetical protein SF051_04965 [Elusimicrobiota bacterium]|nr:hypothetical protein [Elusimicrobiota bacterium]
MSAGVLLLAPLLAAAAVVEDRGLSKEARGRVERASEVLRLSAAYRRLEASVAHLPRRETRASGLPGAVDATGADAPVLLFDAARWRALPEREAQAQLAVALARAELAFPLPVVEAEQAAWQTALRVLVEAAAEDEALSRALDAAYRAAPPLVAEAMTKHRPGAAPWELGEVPPLRLPAAYLARAGLYLSLFEKDPARFHKAVEDGTPWPAGAVRLAELEDLFALRARDIAALKSPPTGAYAELGGRRYPVALVRAAFRVRGTGEVERLRESLAAFETSGAGELRDSFARWRRGAR